MEKVKVFKSNSTGKFLLHSAVTYVVLLVVLSLITRSINIIIFFLSIFIVTWLILFFALKSRIVTLYTDCFEILHVLKNVIIDYHDIRGISIKDSEIKNIITRQVIGISPVISFKTYSNEREINLLYKIYSKEDIKDIICYILSKNPSIDISDNIKCFLDDI